MGIHNAALNKGSNGKTSGLRRPQAPQGNGGSKSASISASIAPSVYNVANDESVTFF
jgi:hypothetical protein